MIHALNGICAWHPLTDVYLSVCVVGLFGVWSWGFFCTYFYGYWVWHYFAGLCLQGTGFEARVLGLVKSEVALHVKVLDLEASNKQLR